MIKENKLTTTFSPKEFEVVDRQGPVVTVANKDTGETYDRIITHVKRIPGGENNADVEMDGEDPVGNGSENVDRPRRTINIPVKYRD